MNMLSDSDMLSNLVTQFSYNHCPYLDPFLNRHASSIFGLLLSDISSNSVSRLRLSGSFVETKYRRYKSKVFFVFFVYTGVSLWIQ